MYSAQTMEAELIKSHWIEVGDGHSLHLGEYGNPAGPVVLYLHGGPGAGCTPDDALLFDTRHWRVLLLDQRGAGLSRPRGSLTDNSITHLLGDLERVRKALAIERWCLAGGSFGATLGLIYSGLYPERVAAQSYWGLFIPSLEGMSWLYGPDGAAKMFSAEYNDFSGGIPIKGWLPLVFEYFHKGFSHPQQTLAERAFRRWLDWELSLAYPGNRLIGPLDWRSRVLAMIELHYARAQYFGAEALLHKALPNISAPTRIIQGECDWVCPAPVLEAFAPLSARLGEQIELVSVGGGYHSLADARVHQAVSRAGNWMLAMVHS
ncbi:alpha/beta fold hydrolase [Shewanella sp. JM162201]|uniref:Proline iminopeptidase n=1 Tax=Shewanella jiangmenensis TaxID=2837387 RepID=A0ABS5V493_9GAMM|nr:alpha/beta fold hydrolase [Shewanella jiangmenensis]MBT1445282.1 alpha/beta fold hydrolase [Shewanella jiangmenensis]